MSGNHRQELKDRLSADLRRTMAFQRVGRVFMLLACLVLVGVGLVGVLNGGSVVFWIVLVFFVLCAAVYGRQVMIDCGLVGPRPGEAGRPTHVVTVTEDGVSCRAVRGATESVSWAALQRVVLQAVDGFPVGDVYWLLMGDDGTGCIVPIEAEGADELLASMQHRLPRFDNEAVVAAMCALEGTAMVWERDPAPARAADAADDDPRA